MRTGRSLLINTRLKNHPLPSTYHSSRLPTYDPFSAALNQYHHANADTRHSQPMALDRTFDNVEEWYGAQDPTHCRSPRSGLERSHLRTRSLTRLPSTRLPHLHHDLQLASSQSSLAHPTNLPTTRSPCLAGLLRHFCTYHTCLLPQRGFRIASSHETGSIATGQGVGERMNVCGGRRDE